MDQQDPPLGPIFLSASVPDPARDKKYSQDLDVIALREATCALAEIVLPRRNLVFGGHPAISPMIATIAKQLHRFDAISVYQSEHFRSRIPSSTLAFPRITWTQDVANDREASLERMREEMLDPVHEYEAGFFIGGMEGVEDEYKLFRKRHPKAAFWPIPTTGAAAAIVYQRDLDWILGQPRAVHLGASRVRDWLEHSSTYRRCFSDLLDLP